MNELRLVFVTFPSMDSARQIGTVLVEKQLAACVNFIPGVESVYRWQGNVESAAEVLAIFKTAEAVFSELEQAIKQLHPYEVPEIVAVSPTAVSMDYLAWVLGSVSRRAVSQLTQ